MGIGSRAVLAILLLAPLGCKHQKIPTQQTEEEPAYLASAVLMGDPRTASQLVTGFHEIESGTWRWTQRQFAVALRPPYGAAQKGARLEMQLTVPPAVTGKLGAVSLTASIEGTAFPAETYGKPGNYIFRREIAPQQLAGNAVRIDFELDKALPPSEADTRELGIVVTRVGLVSK